MNATTIAAPPRQMRVFPEIILVVALPLLSVVVGLTLVFAAYAKGFTETQPAAAQALTQHH